MPDVVDPPIFTIPLGRALGDVATGAAGTERLVRETWRHYYVARLAEAQFGPESLEASIAHARSLSSYRELRGSLRELDPFYRPAEPPGRPSQTGRRHLTLVRDGAGVDTDAASRADANEFGDPIEP